ncbi:MAG: hypothetical protein ACOYNJ_09110 [Candidatus Nanopelagicales bacterium]
MILETVILTALPRSRTPKTLSLSCFLAPRLGGEEGTPRRLPLSRYVDFAEGAWPVIVNAMEWNFVLRWSADDSDEDYLPATRVSADAEPALARILFPGSMPVDPFDYDNIAKRPILSFPMERLARAMDTVQIELARTSPEERPLKSSLVTPYQKDGVRPPDRLPLDPFDLDPRRRASLDSTIDRMLERDGVTRAPAAGSANATAGAVQELNRVLEVPRDRSNVPPLWPDLDFHQAVALLSSHPALMRKLGFIVDLEVPLTGWTPRYGTPRVYVGTTWPGPYDPDARGVDITTSFPRVLTRISANAFRPKADSAFLREDGFVDAATLAGVTSEVEIEVQATQAESTAISRAQQDARDAYGSAKRTGTPARHSTGVTVVQTDYAARMKEIMLRQDAANEALRTGDDVPVAAEDLLLGYRLDVRRLGEQEWRSLHRRHGTLTPYIRREAQEPVDLGDDEGWVEPAASGAPDGEGTIRMSESLARWTGWSLAIPDPGKLIDEQSRASDPAGVAESWEVIDSLHGAVDYAAPATGAHLPTLRFSKTDYEMRLRWVDMAGNSVAPDAAGGSVLRVPVRRQDPILSPGIYLTADPVNGESVQVVVLRTASAAVRNRDRSSRYVAPPPVSAQLALMHGLFDDAGGRPRLVDYDVIADRESAAFPAGPLPANPGTVPYLADPLARGLFVRGVPRALDDFTGEAALAYSGTWPAVSVLELVLSGTAAPGAVTKGGRMTIGVPAGRVARLRLSNSLTQQGLELLDLWRRAASFGDAARARAGAWWQLTPDTELVVVHATQQPLAAPVFIVNGQRRWAATRSSGDSATSITGRVRIDAPSTQSVDFTGVATWFVDDGPGSGPPSIAERRPIGALGTVTVDEPDPGVGQVDAFASLRAPLPDTRRVSIEITALAQSRFAEYFRESTSFPASDNPVVINGGDPVVVDSTRVTYVSAGSKTQVIATARQYRFDAGTSTFTRVTQGLPVKDQIPAGATLTISYVPGPISRSSVSGPGQGRTATVQVPSSARPAPPEVSLVVPVFSWSSRAGNPMSTTRTGGGLRIYLRRPWGSSGLDEQLAVVLLRQGAQAAETSAYVTRWGQDTITAGVQPPSTRRVASFVGEATFTNAGGVVRNALLAETGERVDLVHFAVGADLGGGAVGGYDADRDEWFVDLVMDTGDAYRPMIQLALARYQPVSVTGLDLSPVTLIDVAQLEPGRVATVQVGVKLQSRATVSLTGPSYRSNEFGAGPGLARVILERHMGGSHAGSSTSADWQQVRSVDMSGEVSAAGLAEWRASITIPTVRAAFEYRLAFEQYETFRTDGLGTDTARMTAAQLQESRGLRLVHQDVVFLPEARKP